MELTRAERSLYPADKSCQIAAEPSRQATRAYLSGMKRDELVAPIPGRPWVTGLYEMANSPR